MKQFIPQFIKFPLWFLFKSPQRKFAWFTLWLDILSLISFAFYSVFKIKKLKPISICVGLSNRSPIFLNAFLSSLNNVKNKHLIELSVFDCNSTDVEDLETEIKKKWVGNLIFSNKEMKFTRAVTFNNAVLQSNNETILICDADFSLPINIVQLCNNYTRGSMVWFPIVFYLYKNKPKIFDKKNGEWMQWGGKGILATSKKHFINVGMLNTDFTEWGREDDELWQRFYQHKYLVFRSRCKGFLHHWHPSLNPKYQELATMVDEGKI